MISALHLLWIIPSTFLVAVCFVAFLFASCDERKEDR